MTYPAWENCFQPVCSWHIVLTEACSIEPVQWVIICCDVVRTCCRWKNMKMKFMLWEPRFQQTELHVHNRSVLVLLWCQVTLCYWVRSGQIGLGHFILSF